MSRLRWLLIVSLFTTSCFANAQTATLQEPDPFFSTTLQRHPEKPRNYVWPQIASFLLPGFDQWWEKQFQAAAFYTGTAVGGSLLAIGAAEELDARTGGLDRRDLDSRDNSVRQYILGNQLVMAAGSFSAYHSFRSAVRSRQPLGQFAFLKHEETTDELLLAPFEVSLLKRPTTWIPLVALAGLAAADLGRNGPIFRQNSFNITDASYASAFSYLAGTNEEALFRGWMMPVYMENWQNEFWSNTATALIFSVAHYSSENPVPWPQFVLGWYFGYLTQKNEWTLKEAIFVHMWWDVIAFTASYLDTSRDPRAVIRLPTMTIPF